MLDQECPLFPVNTVRIDFLDRFEKLPRQSELYNARCRRYLLKTISRDAEHEIGALPLVENALQFLWERREGQRLRCALYDDQGGVFGMLESQADGLLEALDTSLPDGRSRALELLLALTQFNDQGNHTRRRLSLDEVRVAAAGRGRKPEEGQLVIDWLAGWPGPGTVNASHAQGDIRLISIPHELGVEKSLDGPATESVSTNGNQSALPVYVDLIHETLIRFRARDPITGRRIGVWKTPYDYIERNPDRSFYRDQLVRQARQWKQSHGFNRWGLLAG